MGRRPLLTLLFGALIAVWTARAAVAQGLDPAAAVAALLTGTEAVLAGPAPDRAADLQRLYHQAFDAQALASRIAPPAVWAAARAEDRARLAAIVLCRLAVLTEQRATGTPQGDWVLIGQRDSGETVVVAVRFRSDDGAEQTLLFDLAGTTGDPRIVDIRSRDGRLSARMAEAILRDAGPPGPDAGAWIASVTCRY